jgi:hypothetical protein
MLDIIKTKLWEILKEKDISLAMVYEREGRILWHKGREIIGKTIQEGDGFSKSFLIKSLQTGEGIDRENVVIASSKDTLPKSAYSLLLKGILIQPIEKDLFLYIDSGTKESFNDNYGVRYFMCTAAPDLCGKKYPAGKTKIGSNSNFTNCSGEYYIM